MPSAMCSIPCSIRRTAFRENDILSSRRKAGRSNAGIEIISKSAAHPMINNGFEIEASHVGLLGTKRNTNVPDTTNTIASIRRSASAVVRTNVLLRCDRELTIAVRINSPARAGSTLLPKYPAEFAQKTVNTGSFAWVLSRTRQRTPRKKYEQADTIRLIASHSNLQCATAAHTCRHSTLRTEK